MTNKAPRPGGQGAELALPFLPCAPGQKIPPAHLVPHGFADVTTDLETLARWFATAPDANWAVRTGPLTDGPWAGQYLAVIDIDAADVAAALLPEAAVTTAVRFWPASRRCKRSGMGWLRPGLTPPVMTNFGPSLSGLRPG